MPRWVATGQKIQKLISSWLTSSAIKETKVKIDNCTVYITPKGCLRRPFAFNRCSHCFHICRSRSKQHHDSAKGEGTQLRSRAQGAPWVVHEMETSPCYFMRSKTTLAQRLPANMEDKVVEFHRFVLSQTALRLRVQPNPEHGRNPDEIRVASHKNTSSLRR